jgi:hypothetical protein
MRSPLRRHSLACVAIVMATRALPAQTPPLNCNPYGNTPSLGTMCWLTHDDTVKGRKFPSGTLLHYTPAGILDFFWIKKPAVVDGLELAGTSEGPHHMLYQDGAPRGFWLNRTQDVQGVPCRPISFWTEIIRHTSLVRFHPNGRLQSCRLGRDATVQGRSFKQGDRVAFDAAGSLGPSAP